MMRALLIGVLLAMMVTSVFAQQPPLPLTDWRARVDADLSTIPMDRQGHFAVMSVMQRYQREADQQAAIAKASEAAAKAKEEAGK